MGVTGRAPWPITLGHLPDSQALVRTVASPAQSSEHPENATQKKVTHTTDHQPCPAGGTWHSDTGRLHQVTLTLVTSGRPSPPLGSQVGVVIKVSGPHS